MNMCIQFMRCACHKIALFLCGDLTRFELVDFYILRYGTGYVAFIAGTRQYALESIQSRAVPVPKLLIKDHKDKDENGNYPTRLVVPATNFTAAIPNLGYRGIRQIFDQEKINYTRKTIIEAAHLKSELETLNITDEKFTIFSLDIEAFYPSTKFKVVERAVKYFAKEVAIVKHWWKDKKTLINSNTEIFGGCRHKTKFHRYNDRNQASTDESNQDEIVEPDINLEGSDSVRIHSLLEECIVTESNQSRLV